MPKTLLLADDSLTIRRVVELTFAEEDVAVTTVGDGGRAMARIQSLPPDIVLADAAMPAPSGYDLAAFVKATPALAHIPVILLTPAFEPIDEARARAAGCDAVLAKPFELTLLVARVKELLRAADARTAETDEMCVSPADVAPADVPPADLPAADLPAADLPPADVSPAGHAHDGSVAVVLPADIAPADVCPVALGHDARRADVPPAEYPRETRSERVPDDTLPASFPPADYEPLPDVSLEQLFDSIDASTRAPGFPAANIGSTPADTQLVPLFPACPATLACGADGADLSLDDYFDMVDEAIRRSQDGPGEASFEARPLLFPPHAVTPVDSALAASSAADAGPNGSARGPGMPRLGGVDDVALIFLSLLQTPVVPPSPRLIEEALRRLLGGS